MTFIGHTDNWQLLTSEANNKRLPPAYLFYGTPGIGKKLVAQELVKFLFCQPENLSLFGDNDASPTQACGQCPACQKLDQNQHPDFFVIEPEGTKIKIDAIRLLQKSLTKAPLEASYQVVVINEAHCLTPQAANSLLKTLEEPSANTLFILISPNLFQILPTIRSRSRSLYFKAPPIDALVDHLKSIWDQPEATIRQVLELAQGAPGLAQKLLDEDYQTCLNQWQKLLSSSDDFATVSKQAQEWASLDIDLVFLLEMMKQQIFKSSLPEITWDDLEKMDRISVSQGDIQRHVNKTLVLENLMMGS